MLFFPSLSAEELEDWVVLYFWNFYFFHLNIFDSEVSNVVWFAYPSCRNYICCLMFFQFFSNMLLHSQYRFWPENMQIHLPYCGLENLVVWLKMLELTYGPESYSIYQGQSSFFHLPHGNSHTLYSASILFFTWKIICLLPVVNSHSAWCLPMEFCHLYHATFYTKINIK